MRPASGWRATPQTYTGSSTNPYHLSNFISKTLWKRRAAMIKSLFAFVAFACVLTLSHGAFAAPLMPAPYYLYDESPGTSLNATNWDSNPAVTVSSDQAHTTRTSDYF